jgi:uncharacterized protein YjbJ (UPF0337 family)
MYANAQISAIGADSMRPSVDRAERSGIDMNGDRYHGIRKQLGGKVRQWWGSLTDDPLAVAAGIQNQRAGRIQERRGIAKQEADRELADFMRHNRNWRNPSIR